MRKDWKKLLNGTRVRHRSKGYEGWIVCLTDERQFFEGPKVNPDGESQYHIYVHKNGKRRSSAEEDLEVCNDIEGVLKASELDNKPKTCIGSEDFASMPVSCTIWTLGPYHARSLLRSGIRSEDLKHTHQINSLKQYVDGFIIGCSEEDDDIGYLYNRLNTILKKGFPIAIVPSHDPTKPNFGLIKLVHRLSDAGRVDASSCLVRSTRIIPQHQAKDYGLDRRVMSRHLKSIEVKNGSLVNSMVVLLLDDIVTTGTSLMACKKLLLDAGASEVICLALGKATQ